MKLYKIVDRRKVIQNTQTDKEAELGRNDFGNVEVKVNWLNNIRIPIKIH
jgi:hypothetical protein